MKTQMEIENIVLNGDKDVEFAVHLAAANVVLTNMNIGSNKLEDIMHEAMEFKEKFYFLDFDVFKTAIRELVSVRDNMFSVHNSSTKPLQLLSTDPILEILLGIVSDNHEIYVKAVDLFRGDQTDIVNKTVAQSNTPQVDTDE